MSDVAFYHLTTTPLKQALPKLLGKVLDQKARAMVLCPDPDCLDDLDELLWIIPDPDWLPHGTPKTGQEADQPIWLTTEDASDAGAPNGARFLFLVNGSASGKLDRFDRVLDFIDGTDEAAVLAARKRWAAAKAAGHKLSYWQQEERGAWKKKA